MNHSGMNLLKRLYIYLIINYHFKVFQYDVMTQAPIKADYHNVD